MTVQSSFPSISNCCTSSQSFYQQILHIEKRKREEYSAIGTGKGDDDGNEEEGNNRGLSIYGELSAKRRHIARQEELPTDQEDVSECRLCRMCAWLNPNF